MIQKSDQWLSRDGGINGRDRKEGEITKEQEETLGDDGYVHYHECGDASQIKCAL